MSAENLEAVRASIDAYLRGDFEAASAYMAPDVVWEVGQELPAQGPEAVRDLWRRWESDWDELETVAEELIEAGDHVVVVMRYRGRGRGSGVEVDDVQFELHTFRDGKCVRKSEHSSRDEALAAAG